jgi:hypothetical protein
MIVYLYFKDENNIGNCIIQNVKKWGIFSIEKKYGALNRGTLIRFLRNI